LPALLHQTRYRGRFQVLDRIRFSRLPTAEQQLQEHPLGFEFVFGLLCFSATWKDPVLWAHYADKHKGLCLAFDVPQSTCKAVNYEKRRLKLPARPTLPDAEALIFTKYVNWQYEQELRIWASLNSCDNGLYFADFGPALKLEKVIAGARCSLSERQIAAAIGPLSEEVIIIKARAGFKEFEIVKDQLGFRS
jgi:Protein of unknown function (DUF2971)